MRSRNLVFFQKTFDIFKCPNLCKTTTSDVHSNASTVLCLDIYIYMCLCEWTWFLECRKGVNDACGVELTFRYAQELVQPTKGRGSAGLDFSASPFHKGKAHMQEPMACLKPHLQYYGPYRYQCRICMQKNCISYANNCISTEKVLGNKAVWRSCGLWDNSQAGWSKLAGLSDLVKADSRVHFTLQPSKNGANHPLFTCLFHHSFFSVVTFVSAFPSFVISLIIEL